MGEFDTMLDTKQLAELLGYTRQNIAYLVKTGKLPYVQRGRKFFFNKDVVKLIVKRDETVRLE
jgi:excisionase family DNA binding protein